MRRLRRRRDGLLEIRPVSWREFILNRDMGGVAVLAAAWVVAVVNLVKTLVVAPMLVGAAGVVLLTVAEIAELSAAAEGGGIDPPADRVT